MPRTIDDIKRTSFIEETTLAYEALLCHYPEHVSTCHTDFEIRYSTRYMADASENLMASHGRMIECALHEWLREEHRLGRLFEKERWKGFLDPIDYWWVEVYYQRLFVYEKYYFQVVLVHEHCEPKQNGHHPVYFELNLYGWIDSEQNTIQKYHEVDIEDDQMMPKTEWDRGRNQAWYEAYDIRQAEMKRRMRWHWKTFKNTKIKYQGQTLKRKKRIYLKIISDDEDQI